MNDQLVDEAYDEESGAGLDLKVLVLYGLGRSRFIVGFLVFVGTALGLIMAAKQPNVYSSVARLHFLAGQREGLTPEALAGLKEAWLPSIGIADEIILLEAPEIYETVARTLGVMRVLEAPDPAAMDTDETAPHIKVLHSMQSFLNAKAAGDACGDEESEHCIRLAGIKLKEKTELVALRGSNVIEVHYESHTPERAQEFAQALVEGFVARHREAFSAESHATKAEEDMQKANDTYNKYSQSYREHRTLCGFQSLGEETNELRQELMGLRKELGTDISRRTQVGGELTEYQKYLARIPELNDKITDPVLGKNPEYEVVVAELLRLKTELFRAWGGSDINQRERDIAGVERMIDAVEERLKHVDPLTEVRPEVVEKVPNPEFFEYQRKVDALTAEDNGLGLAIQEKQKRQRQLEEQLDLAGECEKTHDIWSKRIHDAEQDHDQLRDVYFRVRSLSNLDAEDESNLRIYQAALLPLNKSGPQRMKTVMMGLVGGLAVGMGLAVLRQLMERRVRYPSTLEKQLDLKVLAVVPESASLRKLARRRTAAHA